MKKYISIITCDKCGEEHALHIARDMSANNYLKQKVNYPIAFWQIFYTWAMLCTKCKAQYDSLVDDHKQQREGFLS